MSMVDDNMAQHLTTVRFNSKIDNWILAVLAGSLVASMLAAITIIRSPEPVIIMTFTLILIGTASVLVVWILLATYYTFENQFLAVRCGPMRLRVPLEKITEVAPSRSPLSGPALSLDRLKIKHRGSTIGVLISPVDKSGFLTELAARAPQLQRRGDSLVALNE